MKSPEFEPAALFLRGILALGRRIRSERPSGAQSLSGLGILGTLNRMGPMVATRLAAEERLQPQSLTRLLQDLEKDGLIARARSDLDRRAISIALTDKGRHVLLEDMAARRDWLTMAMAATLTKLERDTLFKASGLMLRLAASETGVFEDL